MTKENANHLGNVRTEHTHMLSLKYQGIVWQMTKLTRMTKVILRDPNRLFFPRINLPSQMGHRPAHGPIRPHRPIVCLLSSCWSVKRLKCIDANIWIAKIICLNHKISLSQRQNIFLYNSKCIWWGGCVGLPISSAELADDWVQQWSFICYFWVVLGNFLLTGKSP